MRKTLCFLIGLYQRFVSPMLPPHCRYTPSCSEYTVQAIEQHGAFYGTWLGVKRLARCNPFGSHGYDPVPGNSDEKKHAAVAGARNSKHNNP